ncbi:sorbin and SH3 domain-containing protein 1 isoform X6 [Bradysia coprophila]|uniref:sorbin and SH3 domain-containing protein 1 isoform X6 n=1 Tax=Bradysia coprophila TaxID=38358 RepID=UPI00187D9DEE|nr:sorbin and SH3 domain-containing protein 1 isoform X6 [Bradysia coprophila]
MNDTTFNDYILIKANPYIISDYDDRQFVYGCNSPTEQHSNQNTLHDSIESNDSCGHSVTTSELFNLQRPRHSDKIDIVPAAVYGPLPFKSPHRYVESDVNIHYKTPVRFEYKDPMSESELAYRQAEQMKKLYQEERRRKYLLEMQDMSNRRHTDNFTPSQKSPIALNRYDDFGPDASPKSPLLPRTVARALYNFQGQTARELSFKKGDIIYIRREIDKNWYEGEHNAAVGLLPSNYIEIITRDGIRITQKKLPEGQARAKFNFHAQSAIELSLNKGELVALTRRVDDNWFEGRIANRKGIFPVSYVDVLTDIGADSTPIISSKPIGSPAAHSLTLAPSPDYSVIRPNFVSDLSAGIVPQSNGYQSNGVVRETKTIQKTEVLHVDTNSEPVAYRAIYKYRPQNSDELELQEGDIVYVLEKCDDGWFVGTSQRTGYFGTFPGNYVERN